MGGLGSIKMSVSRSVTWFSFLVLPDSATAFPLSRPIANSCLKSYEVYRRLGSSFLLLTPILLCCDADGIVNKVLLHCRVADKRHSLCEKWINMVIQFPLFVCFRPRCQTEVVYYWCNFCTDPITGRLSKSLLKMLGMVQNSQNKLYRDILTKQHDAMMISPHTVNKMLSQHNTIRNAKNSHT